MCPPYLRYGLLICELVFCNDSPVPAQCENAKGTTAEAKTDLFGDPLPRGALARMGSGHLRHGASCRIAFLEDGKSLISAGYGRLRIWDTATGKLQQRFEVAGNHIIDFRCAGDEISIAHVDIAEIIPTLEVRDRLTGKIRRSVEYKDQITGHKGAIAHDGKRIAFDRTNSVRICDATTGEETACVRLRGFSTAHVAFAPNGKTIGIADYQDTVYIHDVNTGKKVRELKRDGDRVIELRFSPDGRFLASIPDHNDAKRPGEASIWDLVTGKELHRLPTPGGAARPASCRVAFSPDGVYVATGGPHVGLILWETATGKEIRRFSSKAFFSSGVAFSPDGKCIAAATSQGMITVWDVATGGALSNSADALLESVLALRFSADGKQLSGTSATRINWDSLTGREIGRSAETAKRIWRVPFSPDESKFASADSDGTIRVKDVATGRELHVLKGHDKRVWAMLFATDNRHFYSGAADESIRVWDIESGKQLQRLKGTGDRMGWLAASPDGRWLASARVSESDRGEFEVALWDLATGREQPSVKMAGNWFPSAIAFSPDSRLLATIGATDRSIVTWDITRGIRERELVGHKESVSCVTFSPDGRTLAAGTLGGELVLWELTSRRQRHRFKGHEFEIWSLAFSPDGRRMAATSSDAPVYVWDVAGDLLPRKRLEPAELDRCWTDLAGADAELAFAAIRRLAAAPDQTVPFLRNRLKPMVGADPEIVEKLVTQLDSPRFAERDQAKADLEKLAPAAEPLLRQALRKSPTLEVQRRLEKILERIDAGTPEILRGIRAVEALEWIASPEALLLLDTLAAGAPDTALTRDAIATRNRLRDRKKMQ
ncbi:MAG: WD40 repeat domain-containing protein [Planctomycetes bacterium]|nr:WD40 repeat domain-containing protein [Planctomycetota bacterium]